MSVPGSRSYADATEKLRSAAKWLIAAAAGVGGVLVAGLQLGSLGELALEQWPQLVVATAGIVLSLSGVGMVIHRAAALLTEDWITLSELSVEDFSRRLNPGRKRRKRDVDVIYENIEAYGEELYGRVATSPEDLYRLLRETNREVRARGGKTPPAVADDAVRARDQEVKDAVSAVIEFANYRRTRADFERLQRVLAIAAAAVLVGGMMFAIAAHSPEKETNEKSGTISTATLIRRY
ncbi:hypothetical protein ABZ540_35075 [Nocardia xishanensis]|uniref:hypothetical protein n=1 Tax=Nocardia xishanensis TaxID=238964 RepID=UPI0034102D78